MGKKCFLMVEPFRLRMVVMLLGMAIQGFGWALLIRVNLGIDPYGTFVTGVASRLPISFGTVHLLIQLVLMLFVLKFDLSQIGFGTIGNMFILGYITDFFSWIFERLIPADFFADARMQYLFFVPGLVLLLLGAALYISSGLGVGSYDAIPSILCNRFPKLSYRVIRLAWDGSYMLIGFLLGSKVGIVTIGIALLAGTVISAVQVQVEKAITAYAAKQAE